MTKRRTSNNGMADETMPAVDRAYLCELALQAASVGLFTANLRTEIIEEGTKHATIADVFNITLPGEEDGVSMWIIRGEDGRYQLCSAQFIGGDKYIGGDGDTVQEVTDQWAWVMDKGVQDAISAAKYPEFDGEGNRLRPSTTPPMAAAAE